MQIFSPRLRLEILQCLMKSSLVTVSTLRDNDNLLNVMIEHIEPRGFSVDEYVSEPGKFCPGVYILTKGRVQEEVSSLHDMYYAICAALTCVSLVRSCGRGCTKGNAAPFCSMKCFQHRTLSARTSFSFQKDAGVVAGDASPTATSFSFLDKISGGRWV